MRLAPRTLGPVVTGSTLVLSLSGVTTRPAGPAGVGTLPFQPGQPAPLVRPCEAVDLHAAAYWQGAGTSNVGYAILTNRSSSACTLHGVPATKLVDSKGRVLPVSEIAASGKDVRSMVLQPKQIASMSLQWVNWCGPRVGKPITLSITLPKHYGRLTTHVRFGNPRSNIWGPQAPCQSRSHRSRLYVGPFQRWPPSAAA
jgi:hypothetical protein